MKAKANARAQRKKIMSKICPAEISGFEHLSVLATHAATANTTVAEVSSGQE